MLGGSSLDQRDGLHPRRCAATTTAGRRRARSAGRMPTCCPTSSASKLAGRRERVPRRGRHHRRAVGARPQDPMFTAWIEAARAPALPVTDDYNGGAARASAASQYSIRDGKRCSAAVGYLRPAHDAQEPRRSRCAPTWRASRCRATRAHRRRIRAGRPARRSRGRRARSSCAAARSTRRKC